MYITAQGVNSAISAVLVSFSCIGFHCIYSLFMLNLAKDEYCPPLKMPLPLGISVLTLWPECRDQNSQSFFSGIGRRQKSPKVQ